MKLSKEQKEKMIGEKVIVDEVLVKNNITTNHRYDAIREIETVKLKTSFVATIIGFTFLCEGKIDYVDPEVGSDFLCTKRIPCVKVATGIVGKVKYTPMSIIGKKSTK